MLCYLGDKNRKDKVKREINKKYRNILFENIKIKTYQTIYIFLAAPFSNFIKTY
jgi:hypothetical protein